MITVKSTINIAGQTVPQIIPVVQGDTGRSILFTLADFTIPQGATATYYIQKPSGEAVYNAATVDGNTVLVELTAQSIIEHGDNYGQVRIENDGEIVTSFDFILLVKPFRGIDAVESTTEMNIFDKAVEQAEEAIDEAKVEALEEIAAAGSGNIAEEFDAADSYLAGEYTIYEGKLYRFTSNHTGLWSGSDAEEVTVGDELTALKDDISESGLSADAKAALLACFENVAWIGNDGQDYYDALYRVLYNTTWSVTNTLTNCITSNTNSAVEKDSAYTATITAATGYTLIGATVAVTMGGVDITSSVYSNGVISIDSVTGALVITISAVALAVASISAVYTQSGVVFETDNIDNLKSDLVVTATYNDTSTATVLPVDYTLSGTLTGGTTSTITVTYSGKTTTFDVSVTAWTLKWDYSDGGLPATVAPSSWTASNDAPTYNTISFETGKGIKWVGSRGGYTINMNNYQRTESGTLEIVVNFTDVASADYGRMNVRATLNTASNTLIGFIFKSGIKINGSGSGYNFIPDTELNLDQDYTLRVVRTSDSGKVYLDGVLVYSGELRSLSGTNNVLISTSEYCSRAATVYVKAIRLLHNS